MKKSKESLYDLWDSIRRANTRIGDPEKKGRKKQKAYLKNS